MTVIDQWWNDAACFGREMELFFPEDETDKESAAPAKAICATCPVKSPCLEDALLEDRRGLAPVGIRGGMTGPERYVERIRREGGYAK